MIRPIRVYIAGPISLGDRAANLRQGIDAFAELHAAGFLAFCPHWSEMQDKVHPLKHEEWIRYDLQWLSLCDVLLRLPGESRGADQEEAFAKANTQQVFHSAADLIAAFPGGMTADKPRDGAWFVPTGQEPDEGYFKAELGGEG